MRSITLFLLLISACALKKQERTIPENDLPESVLRAFQTRHPGIHTHFLEQKSAGAVTYEVNIDKEGRHLSERYDLRGNLVEQEEDITFESVSADVRGKMKSYLEDNGASDIQKIQKVKSDTFDGYEVKAKSRKSKTGLFEYFFKADGSFDHEEEVELVSIPTLN